MPRLNINLSEAQSRKPLPDDTYTCRILEIQGPTRGPKASYVTAILEVTEGEFEGRQIYHNMPVDGKGAGIFADFVSKVTGDEIDVDALESYDLDTDDLVGQEISVVTTQEEYPEGSGEYQHKVKKVLSLVS